MIDRGGMNMKKYKNIGLLHGAVLAAGAVFLALGLLTDQPTAPNPDAPGLLPAPPAVSAAEPQERAGIHCEVIQTMGFSRCGHSVTRRVEIPKALAGADFSAVQAYYELWQIDSFSPEQIVMRRDLPLYCPIHTVAGVNEAGQVILSRNMYGDGMALMKECPRTLEEFSAQDQEALLLGLGFDSEPEAEGWLAEH